LNVVCRISENIFGVPAAQIFAFDCNFPLRRARCSLQSFVPLHFTKGFSLPSLTHLSLPRGPSFVWQQKKQKCQR
jgi:hypothetical protein